MNWIRNAPVTLEAVVMCVALFAVCSYEAVSNRIPFADVQREWGVVREDVHAEVHDGVRRAKTKNTQLSGPFDVWNGEWFRIPLTAFHHENVIHLLAASIAALALGRLLEPAWGSFAFGLFLVSAMCVSMMAEICSGHAVMGFSGTVCAMLGALTALRMSNDKRVKSFPIEAGVFGALIILLGVMATAAGVGSFASVSHISGYVYGVAVAAISGGSFRKYWPLDVGLFLFHVSLVPSLFLVTHPFWVGRYQWYRATKAPNFETAEQFYKRAVACDPSLTGVWLRLSEIAEKKMDFAEAWKWLIRGLEANPSDPSLMDSTRRLWRHMDSHQRKDAERILRQAFGERADPWMQSVKANFQSAGSRFDDDAATIKEDQELSGISLDQKVVLPALDQTSKQRLPSNLSDPENSHDNAAEGERL